MLVFVYGTLKKCCSNHYIIEEAKFIGKAITNDPYELYNLYYPCLFESNDNTKSKRIFGEVYEIDQNMLIKLDKFESTPDLYYRKEININIKGELHKAYVYFSNSEKPKNKISIGDYEC
jgi:gamma-glutamylcyclotransferase (GGCT)/AIG2-like uncharacterized protein YtfP